MITLNDINLGGRIFGIHVYLKMDEIIISTKDIKTLLEINERTSKDEETKEATKIKGLEQIKDTYGDQDSKQTIQVIADTKTLHTEKATTSNEKSPQSSNLGYELLKKNLKSDLLTFNRMNNGFIPLSPIFEEYDASLLQFYVPPVMRLVDRQNSKQDSYCHAEGDTVQSYHDIFHSKLKQCRNIYMTSAAGLGKTTFTRKLALTWCLSHDYISEDAKDISEDDVKAMKEFELLFLISLRDSSKLECEIDSMIYNLIIPHLSRSFLYTMNFLQEVLHKKTCLVILDGLDEWSHPSKDKTDCRKEAEVIPHRKSREHCTIFTTTRPWKLEEVNLKCSQIDKQVELLGLNNTSSEKLVENVLSHLSTRVQLNVRETLERFNNEIRFVDIEELKTIPLILMHLIGLWTDGNSLGRSKVEIYTNITEMLLSRAEQKCEDIGIVLNDDGTQTSGKPLLTAFSIFKERSYCYKYTRLLTALGHVAFVTLFDTSQDQSLVFKPETTQKFMKKQEIYFFYKTGLLTKSLFLQQLTRRISTISFAHKTFQEFFASLYIGSTTDCSPDMEYIFNRCKTVNSIIEMANVFIFESGIAPERAGLISQKLFQNVEATPLTLTYRSNACFMNYWNHLSTMKKLQNMTVESMQENKNNGYGDIRLHLADYLLDETCKERNYRTNLINLMKQNAEDVKSIHINGFHDASEISEIMHSFEISKIGCLQRFDVWGKVDWKDLNSAIEKSANKLKYILIHSGEWLNNRWIEQYIPLSDRTLETIQKIHNLETLSLWTIALTHSQLERLMTYLSKRVLMQQISFGAIKCSDHSENCAGVNLDLCEHSELQNLHLNKIPLSNVDVNVSSLEECYIGEFPTEGVLSSILDSLPKARKLYTFGCYYMTSERDVDRMLNAISILSNLRHIFLILVNMGDRSLELNSNMKHIETVNLKRVTMSSQAMNKLLTSTELLQQSVRLDIMNCSIMPEDEFAKIKRYVRTSGRFIITEDGLDHRKRNAFSFTTKKTMCINITLFNPARGYIIMLETKSMIKKVS
ncbi:uncharacterized protein LOC123524311 isoform X2 [Mercenaria mercenaria]|uniref:uncharacterized protein LOC123524311 isoform X2 n=1 Tax=Mercenaria mercenaria TaxID=6596 RepID=UPI00234F3C46|nr:uncharacterized protein LOC123524311 isoform X2 [Mercenaria mercenaria]